MWGRATSANQEDHVSMACHAARRLLEMNANLAGILGIEALCAAQGIELRAPLRTSTPLADAIEIIRLRSQPIDEDRMVSQDIEATADLVLNSAALSEVACRTSQIDILS
ncbi:aromatic amino acid lyase [uncultured Hyphomonas sp.]|uniref:aromatic amino acid lyase n=1 Tax=uncultured Hyphomonas sp. TaxID=225298 RepID=UPI0023522ED7|nr:aromatic amino acid lyase [Hyphomonas atlantica]